MRILYLHQYFVTPSMVGGTRSYEMARRFVAAGHEVNMITSTHELSASDKKDWYETNEAGIRVHWLPVLYSNNLGTHARIKAFLQFAVASRKKAREIGGDVVFATSTPLTIAIPGVYAAKKNKVPMVFEVRDVWPEAAIQMRILASPFTILPARWLEKWAYRNSVHIVALTPGMRDGVLKSGVVPDNNITVIPNGSDLDLFSPEVDGDEFREKLKLGSRFTLSYFGTLGPANGLHFVLDAASELKRRKVDDVVFVLHGRGKERPGLQKRAEEEGLDNVVFSDPVAEKTAVARLAAASDACMTIYKNLPILHTCSPNKIFDSFAAGKPVLTNMPGWLQSLVQDHRAGVFCEPDNPIDFADKVLYLRDHPDECREFATNSRRLAEEVFSRDLLAKKLLKVLNEAVRHRGRPVPRAHPN